MGQIDKKEYRNIEKMYKSTDAMNKNRNLLTVVSTEITWASNKN